MQLECILYKQSVFFYLEAMLLNYLKKLHTFSITHLYTSFFLYKEIVVANWMNNAYIILFRKTCACARDFQRKSN